MNRRCRRRRCRRILLYRYHDRNIFSENFSSIRSVYLSQHLQRLLGGVWKEYRSVYFSHLSGQLSLISGDFFRDCSIVVIFDDFLGSTGRNSPLKLGRIEWGERHTPKMSLRNFIRIQVTQRLSFFNGEQCCGEETSRSFEFLYWKRIVVAIASFAWNTTTNRNCRQLFKKQTDRFLGFLYETKGIRWTWTNTIKSVDSFPHSTATFSAAPLKTKAANTKSRSGYLPEFKKYETPLKIRRSDGPGSKGSDYTSQRPIKSQQKLFKALDFKTKLRYSLTLNLKIYLKIVWKYLSVEPEHAQVRNCL